MRNVDLSYIHEWVIVDNGPDKDYPLLLSDNAYDTNGVNNKPVRYYVNGGSAFDSTSGSARKTSDGDTTWYVFEAQMHAAVRSQFRVFDDDGFLRGGTYWIYADSAPPPPDTVAPSYDVFVNAAAVTLTWQGVDVHDGDQTQYRILMDANTNPTTVVSDYKTGSDYTVVGGGSFSATVTPPGNPGTKFWRIEAMDARGSVSAGPVSRFIYNP